MQTEVIEIQCDSDSKAKFSEVGVIISAFGSTYQCEQLVTLVRGNESPVRSRITDAHLGSVLKVRRDIKCQEGNVDLTVALVFFFF